ncbi:minor tail protein Z domain protein [Escherichia coli LT-68]|nr:minor tail protein Z domain protein [Escherichia coli LT-68]
MKGLENAIRNLNSLDTRMVPQASAWAVNRVAAKIISVATRQVAQNTVAGDNQVKGIPLKTVRERVRLLKASPSGKCMPACVLTGVTCPPLSWVPHRSDWPAPGMAATHVIVAAY